ncbi:hypothetical protein HDU85_004390 [Gaertneriomyces sp. JEL0708]|nr:hypothetical protein HDU85_004390 [Gaertneriomyces sp. JEL0708]
MTDEGNEESTSAPVDVIATPPVEDTTLTESSAPTPPAPPTSTPAGPKGFSLTPEQREKIKKQLLERQRQARGENNSATAVSPSTNPASSSAPAKITTTSTITTTSALAPHVDTVADESLPRQNLISLATTFLSSSAVQSSPRDKKIAFLKNKGLTDAEIAIAETRVGSSPDVSPAFSSGSSHAPHQTNVVPPPRPPPPPPHLIQQIPHVPQELLPPPSRADRIKTLLLILALTGGGFATLVHLFKKHCAPALRIFAKEYTAFLDRRKELVQSFGTKIISFAQVYADNTAKVDNKEAVEGAPAAERRTMSALIRSSVESCDARLNSIQALLQEVKQLTSDVPDSSASKLSDAVQALHTQLATHTYFPPSMYSLYSTYAKPGHVPEGLSQPAAEYMQKITELKGDIRTLKGMLLSRRNFPAPR